MTVFIISCELNIRSSSCKTQKYFFSTGSLFISLCDRSRPIQLTRLSLEEEGKAQCRYRGRSLRLLSHQPSSFCGLRDLLLIYDLLVEMILPVITSPIKGANSISRNETGSQLTSDESRSTAGPTFIIHHSVSPCHFPIFGCPDIIH